MPERKKHKLSFPTETVVVRGVDRALWQQFKDVCQMHGVTAFQKIRQMIWETAKEGAAFFSYLPETA